MCQYVSIKYATNYTFWNVERLSHLGWMRNQHFRPHLMHEMRRIAIGSLSVCLSVTRYHGTSL